MNESTDFLNIHLLPRTLDVYIIRSRILLSVENALPCMSGRLLDLGCGHKPYKEIFLSKKSNVKEYVGIDLPNNKYTERTKPDLYWDGDRIPLESETVDCVVATEVFEHCRNLQMVLEEIYRVLKPGGILFFTMPFIWPLHDVPHDEHRLTPFALRHLFEQTNYTDIELQSLGGWDAALAQVLALWIRRRLKKTKIQRVLRMILSILFLPIVFILYRLDMPNNEFHESSMIIGISGMTKKNDAYLLVDDRGK